MTDRADEIERAIHALRTMLLAYPEWRVGQTVCNVALWARNGAENAVWHMEDAEFISEVERHCRDRLNAQAP